MFAGNNGASGSNGSLAATDAADATLVLEGQQFRDFVVGPGGVIDRAAFSAIWPRLRVLARCSPTDKYTIVQGQLHHVPCASCRAAHCIVSIALLPGQSTEVPCLQ